jgi:transposase
MTAYRRRGSLAPKRLGGGRHAKLDPHREFLLRRVAEKDDITMPELGGELATVCGAKVDPASISRWFIRNGYPRRFDRDRAHARGCDVRSHRSCVGMTAFALSDG